PASLPHVGAPPDQLLPFLRGRAKDPQVRYLFPLGGIRFGRRRHGAAGGRAISRVRFSRGAGGGRPSVRVGRRQPPHAAYPQLGRPGPGLAAYLALLRLGVTVPRLLPGARWALTPPFHPYPWIKGGLFSVARSVALRRPGVTWQSALWSSDFPQ